MDDLSKRVTLSEGVDATEALPKLAELLKDGWVINDEKNGIKKCFHFNAYTKVMVWISKNKTPSLASSNRQ